MAVKIFSDRTHKYYNTVDEANKAELEAEVAENRAKIEKEKKEQEEKALREKKAAERKERAAEVETARKDMVAAQNKYREVLEKFVKDYGSYHLSWTNTDEIPTLFDFFHSIF